MAAAGQRIDAAWEARSAADTAAAAAQHITGGPTLPQSLGSIMFTY